jgi:Domain of unknown function (DUF4105)
MNPAADPSWFRRLLRFGARIVLWVVLAGMAAWSILAVYYSNLPGAWLRTLASVVYGLGLVLVFVFVRPHSRARWVFLALFSVVVAWFLLTPPSNQRDWQPDVAVLPYADVKGNEVTIHNIRNCDYRTETDYTVGHYDKTFDLGKLQSVDLFLVYWGSPLIAHTMLSFGFEGGDHLCISIETRKTKGQEYSAIKGFFRQFELIYVVGDERDLVRLRTNYRGEQVYLYRLSTEPAVARLVLLDYLNEVNQLKEHPEWYNVLTSNCTTNIRGHTKPYARKKFWDWRLLVNGYVDEMAYEVGSLDRSLPFKDLKARSLINSRAKAADEAETFSERIRDGLPGFGSASGSLPARNP